MKTDIILKKTKQRVSTHAETARLLIEMGRAVTVEDHLAAKRASGEVAAAEAIAQVEMEAAIKAAEADLKGDAAAEDRLKKVVEPALNKAAARKGGKGK